MSHRDKPQSALDTLKEYASFGYPIPMIEKQMEKDGFSSQEIRSAVSTLKSDTDWREFLLNAISQLKRQGLSANEIVKTLGISDEEYNAHFGHLTAMQNSLSKKDKLLLIAEQIENVAQELEKYIPKFKKIKPKDIEIPEDLAQIQELDKRSRLTKLIDRANVINDDIKQEKEKLAELRETYVAPVQQQITNLTEEEQQLAEGIATSMIEEYGALDAGEQITLRHKNLVVAVLKNMSKIPDSPDAQSQLEYVLENLERTDAKLFARISQMLDEFVKANTAIEEHLETMVAVFPIREKHLKGVSSKIAQWWSSVQNAVSNFIGKIHKYVNGLLSINDDIDNNTGAVGDLLNMVTASTVRENVKDILR